MKKLFGASVAGLMVLGMAVGLVVPRVAVERSGPRLTASVVHRALASLKESLVDSVPYMQQAKAAASNGPLTQLVDANWSGFADGATYQPVAQCTSRSDGCQSISQVMGSWTVPAITCPSAPFQYEDQLQANWVGIDGLNDTTVEQTGSIGECFEGVAYYNVWYELYPENTVVEGPSSCLNNNIGCPRAGDHISASVTVTPAGQGEDAYKVTLTDLNSPANSFSVTQDCATNVCFDDSADWIVERPTFPVTGITPLADFGQTSFSNGSLTAYGRQTDIQGYPGGVYDIEAIDSTQSYFLDCVGQTTAPGLLLLPATATAPNPCPPVGPSGGNGNWASNTPPSGNGQQGNGRGYYPAAGSSFNLTWDVAY
jgi:hypothetical protein